MSGVHRVNEWGGGGGEGVQLQILKTNRSRYFFLKKNDAKFIILRIVGKDR